MDPSGRVYIGGERTEYTVRAAPTRGFDAFEKITKIAFAIFFTVVSGSCFVAALEVGSVELLAVSVISAFLAAMIIKSLVTDRPLFSWNWSSRSYDSPRSSVYVSHSAAPAYRPNPVVIVQPPPPVYNNAAPVYVAPPPGFSNAVPTIGHIGRGDRIAIDCSITERNDAAIVNAAPVRQRPPKPNNPPPPLFDPPPVMPSTPTPANNTKPWFAPPPASNQAGSQPPDFAQKTKVATNGAMPSNNASATPAAAPTVSRQHSAVNGSGGGFGSISRNGGGGGGVSPMQPPSSSSSGRSHTTINGAFH